EILSGYGNSIYSLRCTLPMRSYPYLLELRLGHAREKLNAVIREVKDQFKLTRESPRVAHLTLYGPFAIKPGYSFRDIKTIVSQNARNISTLPYWVDGYEHRLNPNGGVIAFRIIPSDSFRDLFRNISRDLQEYTISKNEWDRDPEDHWYHVTIAFHLSKQRYQQILRYLNIDRTTPSDILSWLISIIFRKPQPDRRTYPSIFFPVEALRITLLRNSLISAEYDLLSRRWYGRMEAKSEIIFGKTLQEYRLKKRFEITGPEYPPETQTYVIGDLHLGHANIIKYCARPFLWKKPGEMDYVLIRNWNNLVKKTDTVYFLGDLCGPKSRIKADQYFRYLNGKIIWIKGNHDEQEYISSVKLTEYIVEEYDGIKILFTHDPETAPDNDEGWVIHGHKHNNNLRMYPFFNPRQRRVNVSAEVVGYRPVLLSEILQLISTEKETRFIL
ncbi:MAG: 2'-5' RNA ligase family protein, partial [Methanomicrobiales archaeon]|nr:2'-5' RNA ligase family protein [Methanomicrobiales archaeon]